MHPAFLPSYWEQDVFHQPYDVLVIGMGIVGLNAAISLKERLPRLRLGVLDRQILPSGASTRNAGFACFGSISELMADLRSEGLDRMLSRVAQRKAGLDMLIARSGMEAIGYQPAGGYEVFLPDDEARLSDCLDHLDELNRYLHDIFGTMAFIPDKGKAGMRNVLQVIAHPLEGCLHPGLLMRRLLGLVRDADIDVLSGVEIQQIQESPGRVFLHTDIGYTFKTRYVVVATNGFARTLIPGLDVVPARNQVYVTAPLATMPVRGCYHYNEGYVYFRDVEDRLLIGGARHLDREAEATDQPGFTERIREWLMAFTQQHILGYTPQIAHKWSGIMGVGSEKQPIVRMVSDRVAAAVRLGGMGVAIGSVVGDQVAALIAERL